MYVNFIFTGKYAVVGLSVFQGSPRTRFNNIKGPLFVTGPPDKLDWLASLYSGIF